MKLVVVFLCFAAQLCVTFANDAHFLSDKAIAETNDKQDSWKAGRNFDPNTPLSELQMLLGTIMEGRDMHSFMVKTSDPSWPEEKKIPKRFDSRRRWRKKCPKIGEVLDQGRCGSCWAIAAAQAFTDRYCIATKGKHQARLSTANVLSCCGQCGFGCSGGWENLAWNYFSSHGLPSGGRYNTTDGCQPYNIQSPCNYNDGSPYEKCPATRGTPACNTSCTNNEYRKDLSKDYRFGNNAYALEKDEKAIMKEIMTHGPVTAAFHVYPDFMTYKSGVYDPADGQSTIGGHAIKLIGWGVEKKKPYWLVMNSWNEYWGDHGLVKMLRNSPKIKLENEAYAALSNPKKRGYTPNEDEEDAEDSLELEEDENDSGESK